MKTNLLGASGPAVSRVGLGGNNFGRALDRAQTGRVVEAAIDVGVTFFDTADIYGNFGDSERFLGDALKGRRDHVVIATKFGRDMNGQNGEEAPGSAGYVRRALEASLLRLQTDYVDVLYYHVPDGVTPFAETLGAMHALVTEGKVRAVGVSTLTAAQLREVADVADVTKPVVLQNLYSLLDRGAEQEILPLCREEGIGLVPFYPLANGLLTGKYRHGEPPPAGARLANGDPPADEVFDRLNALERFAQEHGRTLLELAVSGLASQPGVASVITGATTPEQIRANAAAGGWELSQAELDELAPL